MRLYEMLCQFLIHGKMSKGVRKRTLNNTLSLCEPIVGGIGESNSLVRIVL